MTFQAKTGGDDGRVVGAWSPATGGRLGGHQRWNDQLSKVVAKSKTNLQLLEELQKQIFLSGVSENFPEVSNSCVTIEVTVEARLGASHASRTKDSTVDQRQNPLHVEDDKGFCADFKTHDLYATEVKNWFTLFYIVCLFV